RGIVATPLGKFLCQTPETKSVNSASDARYGRPSMGSSASNLSELRVSPTAFSQGPPPRGLTSNDCDFVTPTSRQNLPFDPTFPCRQPRFQVAQSHAKPDPNGPGVGLGRGMPGQVTRVHGWTVGRVDSNTNSLSARDFAHSLCPQKPKPSLNGALPKS